MGYYEGIGSLCCFRYMPTEFLINYNRDCIRNEVTNKEVFDIEGNVLIQNESKVESSIFRGEDAKYGELP